MQRSPVQTFAACTLVVAAAGTAAAVAPGFRVFALARRSRGAHTGGVSAVPAGRLRGEPGSCP